MVRLRRAPGITAAAPILSTYTRNVAGGRPFLLVGLDPLLDRGMRAWAPADPSGDEAAWARLMAEPFTIFAGETLAREAGWQVGDRVVLTHRQGNRPFTVAGRIALDGLGTMANGRIAICDIATFQEFTGTHGRVDRIDLRLTDRDADLPPATVSILGGGVQVGSPGAVKQSGRGMIRAYQVNLSF